MRVGHVIGRLELALVVGSKDTWFGIVQRIKILSLRSIRRRNKEDKQNPRAQGQVFDMTHQDAQATTYVVTSTI